MANRDLNLNSLGRNAKNSEHLILEEHGHCEVPAGCGGVVLRWRTPESGLLFLLQLYVRGKYSLFIDGVAPPSGRPLIPFGRHAFALAIEDALPQQAILAFAAIHNESEFGFPNSSRPSNRNIAILSAADGNWKYVATQPATSDWMRPGFDDSRWSPMIQRDPPSLDKSDMSGYRLRAVLKLGADCLGIEGSDARLWVRKEFTIVQSLGADAEAAHE